MASKATFTIPKSVVHVEQVPQMMSSFSRIKKKFTSGQQLTPQELNLVKQYHVRIARLYVENASYKNHFKSINAFVKQITATEAKASFSFPAATKECEKKTTQAYDARVVRKSPLPPARLKTPPQTAVVWKEPPPTSRPKNGVKLPPLQLPLAES
jgi:hypothetical protein